MVSSWLGGTYTNICCYILVEIYPAHLPAGMGESSLVGGIVAAADLMVPFAGDRASSRCRSWSSKKLSDIID